MPGSSKGVGLSGDSACANHNVAWRLPQGWRESGRMSLSAILESSEWAIQPLKNWNCGLVNHAHESRLVMTEVATSKLCLTPIGRQVASGTRPGFFARLGLLTLCAPLIAPASADMPSIQSVDY